MPVLINDISELLDVRGDLGLQRRREHLPGPIADQLIQQRPDRCGRLLRAFLSNYREHGRTFPTGVGAPALLEDLQGSSGRYAHQAPQPEISDPQVLIIPPQLGRAVELAHQRLRPCSDDAAPVVYLTMPPQATPKSLSIEILKFLGAPYLARDSQIELTRQACHLLADLRNQLLIVDEIHNLDHHTKAGADASDHLKYLAENVASTFVYAGIDTARTGLFNGIRGRQLAGRFVPIHTRPYPYATTGDRAQWRDLVTGFDSMLRLHRHKPGTLTRLAPYLHTRTAGSISSLSMLIRFAAVTAIGDGTERITKASLHDVPLDHAATSVTARPAKAKPPAA